MAAQPHLNPVMSKTTTIMFRHAASKTRQHESKNFSIFGKLQNQKQTQLSSEGETRNKNSLHQVSAKPEQTGTTPAPWNVCLVCFYGGSFTDSKSVITFRSIVKMIVTHFSITIMSIQELLFQVLSETPSKICTYVFNVLTLAQAHFFFQERGPDQRAETHRTSRASQLKLEASTASVHQSPVTRGPCSEK